MLAAVPLLPRMPFCPAQAGQRKRRGSMQCGLWRLGWLVAGLGLACGPSPRQACTKYAEKITCVVQNIKALLQVSPGTDPNTLAALQAFDANTFINRCVDAYQKSSKACQKPLAALTDCADKSNCSVSIPCQSELKQVFDLGCLPADLLPTDQLKTYEQLGKAYRARQHASSINAAGGSAWSQ